MYKLSHPSALSLVLLASGASAVPAARADEASATQPSASTLQEVVVTAQKREEKLHDVPMGVTAVTSEELEKRQLVDLEDLQSTVPGLSLQMVQPGQTRISIRGQNVGGAGSTVTTYIDDTPFGSSNALANGFGLTGDFDTWDLQRVEVLRGPQGTLYGAGSEGGLLKYVTNSPDPTKFAGALQVGGEDIAHGESAGSVKGMINLPIGGAAAFRVSGSYSTLPGYIDDPQLGEKDINHGYRTGLHASFLWQATDSFSVKLNAFGQTLHTDGTPYVDVVGAAGNPIAPPANQLDPQHGDYEQYRFINEPATNKYRIYSGTLEWNLGGATLTSITSYGTTEQDLFIDATSLAAQPGVTFGDIATGVAQPFPPGATAAGVAGSSDLTAKKFTQEVRLASSSTQTFEWQVGAFYTHESTALDQNLPSFYIPSQADTGLPGLETLSLDSLYREWAAFAQGTYHFNPKFDLAVGGRWSENRQSADQTIGGLFFTPPQLTSGESTDTDFTYSVAPRWHISTDTMVYARVASGYRPGGPNALPPTGVPATVPKAYGSDSTVNYELGSRATLLDNRLSVDIAAFLVDWKKIQLIEYVDNVGVNANGGTARSKGVEWTFALTPLAGLTFTLTGAYVDAYLTSPAPATGGNSGDSLPYAPKWSTSLDGAYTWRAFGNFNAFAGATWSYIGSRLNDFSATPDNTGGFVPNPQAELPSYNTVGLRAGLDSGRWMFELYGKNVGDVRGITYYTNSGTPNFGGAIAYSQPRTIGAAVTARF
jgi:outer membrane receptor protein involved in Fe transport